MSDAPLIVDMVATLRRCAVDSDCESTDCLPIWMSTTAGSTITTCSLAPPPGVDDEDDVDGAVRGA